MLDNFLVDGTVLLNTGVGKTVHAMSSNPLLLDRNKDSVNEKEIKEDIKEKEGTGRKTQMETSTDQGNLYVQNQFYYHFKLF